MKTTERIKAFVSVGSQLENLRESEIEAITQQAARENPWFTPTNVMRALKGISHLLVEDKIDRWLSGYRTTADIPKTIGVIAAGNIPMVGFHDLLCVLMSGHYAAVKLSSQDSFLMKMLLERLTSIEPKFSRLFGLREQLKDIDAIIATGSDNTARYFHYYFSKYPHIIRKNRTSVAVLTGEETDEELKSLGHDVFDYFGLGCRNVSKLLVPNGYDFVRLLDQWKGFSAYLDHHKYRNNYDYHKSILLINKEAHLDSGFSLLRESDDLVSPVSITYYQSFDHPEEITRYLAASQDKLQCVVGSASAGHIPFGQAQLPELWDYADNVDTMRFLENLD